MKLYLIVFSTLVPNGAKVHSSLERTTQTEASHIRADGFPVVRESVNCRVPESFPEGMPTRYRKADKYKVLNNKSGIYMFGRDPARLVREWNSAAVA